MSFIPRLCKNIYTGKVSSTFRIWKVWVYAAHPHF